MNEYGFEAAPFDEKILEKKPARFRHEDLFEEAEKLEVGSCLVKEFKANYEANEYALTLRNHLNTFKTKDDRFFDLKIICRKGKVYIVKGSEQ